MNRKIISERMKDRREEIGVSVSEIAEKTGLTKATLYRYEKGEIERIKLPVIESIATILRVNPDWLAGKSDNKDKVITTNYVELKDRNDIRKIFDGLTEYISAKENLLYDGEPLTPELRISLITNIEAVVKIIDKMKEK